MQTKLILGSLLVTGAFQPLEMNAANPKNQPNIIYILADDMGYGDLSCYGQKKFKTPNIDKLAASGIRFTQHYAGSSVSAPSRSALLTGQHTGHTPIRGNKNRGNEGEGQMPLPASTITIPELLQTAGYTTGAFGKWGLGYPGSEGDPVNQGFDEFFGYNCHDLAHSYYPYHLWHNREKIILNENAGQAYGAYAPNLIHDKAIEFIKANKKSPFFMYYATVIPHAELIAPEKYLSMFKDKFLPEPKYTGVDSGEGFREGMYMSQTQPHAAFAAMITLLDEQVGELVAELKMQGLDKNTIIVFSSDNGPHKEGGGDPDYFDSNGPLRGYKRDLYEGGIREPMIVSWPAKIKMARTTNHVSAFWDVMPTLAEIAGVQVPKGTTDGISFLPTLLNKKQTQHDYLYWEFHEMKGRVAMRMGKWKALQFNYNTPEPSPMELYDLDTDPGESTNLASKFPDIVEIMKSKLQSARTPSDVFKFRSKTVKE